MNALQTLILQEIKRDGPITVERFMELALYHPKHGYYTCQDVLGKKGDYITAPELTQVFGELLALWVIDAWQQLGSPPSVQLIEMGPGRGVMMQDILRIAKKFPEFYQNLNVYLVEVSPLLKGHQQDLLKGEPVQWAENLQDIPEGKATFFLANEFFDALPIEQYVCVNGDWRPRRIGEKEDQLYFLDEAPIKEGCKLYEPYMKEINRRLLKDKGGALIIDYGDDLPAGRLGDTLQSLYRHHHTTILENPGQQDLTHHVSFAALKDYLDPALKAELKDQGEFLTSLGLDLWVQKLCQLADQKNATAFKLAASRLVSPQEMGRLFKVLAINIGVLP